MTNSMASEPYVRVRIAGKLICTSDLHVGTGNLEPFEERIDPEKRNDKDKIKGGYNSVCLDARRAALSAWEYLARFFARDSNSA
ncbi:MAG: hypothetical protein ACREXS_19075 [Gammaproteobacteria bacterium]